MLTTTVLFFAPTAASSQCGSVHCSTTGLMLFLTVLPQLTGIPPNPDPAKRPYQISSSGPSRYRAPLLLAMSIPGRVLGQRCVKRARAALPRPREERRKEGAGQEQPAMPALTSENPLQVALKVQSPLVEGAGGHGHCPAHGSSPAAFPAGSGAVPGGGSSSGRSSGPSSRFFLPVPPPAAPPGSSSRSVLLAPSPASAAAPAPSALQAPAPRPVSTRAVAPPVPCAAARL